MKNTNAPSLDKAKLIEYGYTVQPYNGDKFLLFDAGNCSAGFASDTEEGAWEAGLAYLNKWPGNVTRRELRRPVASTITRNANEEHPKA